MPQMRDPVVPSIRGLYGHPGAGGYWERHCDAHFRTAGLEPVHDNWPSDYFHSGLKLFLMVYIDGFKLCGPSGEAMAKGWKLIQQGITMDDPTPVGKCIVCKHVVSDHVFDGHQVNVMEYGVCDFMNQCVTAYKDSCRKPNTYMRIVDTPHSSQGSKEATMLPTRSPRGDNRRYGADRLCNPDEHIVRGSASALGYFETRSVTRFSRYKMTRRMRQSLA